MKARFYYCHNEWARNYFQQHSVYFSESFCVFFADRFEELFVEITGIKPSTKVTLGGFKQSNNNPMYEPGLVSKLNLVLWIMPDYYDDISFCWRSKTHKIIKITEENFDENDLEYWIEGLKPSEYWKYIATEKKSHPFEINRLPFELKVFQFGIQMQLRLFLVNENERQTIIDLISQVINKYNFKSENMNRSSGVVHNFHFEEDINKLNLIIDTGSAGVSIIKQILKAATKFSSILKIETDI